MKRILILALLTITTNTYAETNTARLCPRIKDYAALVMSQRQAGDNLAEVIIEVNKIDHADTRLIGIHIAEDAANQQIEETFDNKVRLVTDFANYWETNCYNDFGRILR